MGLFVGVVAAADQGAGLYVAEAHRKGLVLEESELVRRIEAGHRQMVAAGAEILADGEDVDLAVGEVTEDLQELVHLLAHAYDDAGLGYKRRGSREQGVGSRETVLLGFGEELQAALVAASGFGDAVEAGDGLDVVVQDLGAGGYDHAAGFGDALEIGREDFDLGAGGLFTDLLDDVDEGLGGTEVVIIAVDAGDDGVGEAELGYGVGDAGGLGVVDRLGAALGDGAEAAAARAEVAEHHEGGRLVIPALADVRAVGGLADGVQVELAGEFLERVEGLTHGSAGLEPGRLGDRFVGRQVDLDEGVGLDEKCHFPSIVLRGGGVPLPTDVA